MIRKDTALDADRPHYYSQFWIDIASGQREIGGPRTATTEAEDEFAEAAEAAEAPELADVVAPEPEAPEEAPAAKPARPSRTKAEPKRAETPRPALTSLADLAKIDLMMKSSAEMGDETVPDIEGAASAPLTEEEAIVTDFDPNAVPFEEEPADVAAEATEEEFEDLDYDETDEWGEDEGPRRGSKPQTRKRRESRREF